MPVLLPVASPCPDQKPTKGKPKGHGQPWEPKLLANRQAPSVGFFGWLAVGFVVIKPACSSVLFV